MLGVFVDDCVMELRSTGEQWRGKGGAEAFYRAFLGAFEGMEWVPQALVIGPQGVLDVVDMTGRVIKPFAGLVDPGARVHLQWVIYFPWLPDQDRFRGETVFSITPLRGR